MQMRRLAALLVAALLAAPPAVAAWRPWPPPRNGTAVEGLGASKKFEGSSEFVKLQYHMGPILAASITVHPIWYGPWLAPQKRTIAVQRFAAAAGVLGGKKLRRPPHIFAKVLELPFAADADVSVEEDAAALRFVTAAVDGFSHPAAAATTSPAMCV